MYQHDYENRITKIVKSGPTTVAEFAYDALGRRIKKVDSVGGTTSIYYYNDRWQVLSEYNGSNSPQRWFAYGNYIDEVLVMNTSTAVILAKLYVHDHLYSPVALVQMYHLDLKERYEYDAYGKATILDPQYAIRDTSLYGNPYYFTGRQLDFLDGGNLKIQYNRNRYYDYYTGRWLTHDPMGIKPNAQKRNRFDATGQYDDGVNLYEYVRSHPLSYVDAYGLCIIYPGPGLPPPKPSLASTSCCEALLPHLLSHPDVKPFHDKASTMKDAKGMPCLAKVECIACGAGGITSAGYDTKTRRVLICKDMPPGCNLASAGSKFRERIRHELVHAISMCGLMPKTCLGCMIEEKRAYFYDGSCTSDFDCTRDAWYSCGSSRGKPCDEKKDKFTKYLDVGGWPPRAIKGVPCPELPSDDDRPPFPGILGIPVPIEKIILPW